MRTHGDVPRASSYGPASGGREPGSDVDLPPCACPTIALSADAVRGLTEAQIAELVAAECGAAMHYCRTWPARRREPPASTSDGPP